VGLGTGVNRMNDEYKIRKAAAEDAAGMAKVHVDSWRATYKGIVSDEFLEGLSYSHREAGWRQRIDQNSSKYDMFVAQNESGHIVGFADGGPERSGDPVYDGELYAIYLLQDYQKQGIGRRLFQHVVQHLVESGFRTMLIWVLAENPSRRFYESLGGQPIRETGIEIGGEHLSEIAYGWSDLAKVMSDFSKER